MPTVEIIATGSELLAGQHVNTNAVHLSRELSARGFSVARHQSLGDDRGRLAEAVRQALAESELVITTGGLGPTLDDVTRDAISEATGILLRPSEEVAGQIRERFRSLGREMTDNNLVQAAVPTCGGWFPNPHGTAPGLYFELGERMVLALPGPPRELNPMFEEYALPLLLERFPPPGKRLTKSLCLTGLGESNIDEICRPIVQEALELTYSILARPGLVNVTLSRWVEPEVDSDDRLDEVFRSLQKRLGVLAFALDDKPLEAVVGEMLRDQGKVLATAESCTGGLIAESITSIPGSSDYFAGSFVTYSNEMKTKILGVDPMVIEEHGAVSPQVARAMAEGARRLAEADYAISVTGIAGPSGGTPEKPVGLVYIALADAERAAAEEFRFFGSREAIRERSRVAALNQLRLRLLKQIG